MKKLILTFVIISAFICTFATTAWANEVPPKKTQIDWLISGAGGDVETAGGNLSDVTGEFSYDFTAEDGSLKGAVVGKSGQIKIYKLGSDGKYTEASGSDPVAALARHYTQHFATLTRTGHFHASHKLSARSTEEYPITLGSTKFITFCYPELDDGGIMSAMILDGKVKFISGLQKSARSIPLSDGGNAGNSGNNNAGNTGNAGNSDNAGNSGNTDNSNAGNTGSNNSDNTQDGNSGNGNAQGGNTGNSGNTQDTQNNAVSSDPKSGFDNPPTGISFGIIPVVIVGAALLISKKKKRG